MDSKIELNTDLSSIENLAKASFASLKENQIIQIHVLDKLSENKYVLFFNGSSFFADSKVTLEKGQTLLAKIKSLEPSLIFSLLDFNKNTKLNSEENVFKQKLSEINITPNEKNISVAKAFAEEFLPLKNEYLTSFIANINKIGIEAFDDIRNAVKLFKLNLPLNNENIQRFSEIFSVIPTDKLHNIDSLTKGLELIKSEIQDKEWLDIQKNYDVLKNIFSDASFNKNVNVESIYRSLQKSVSFAGDSYEKQIISSLSEAFFNPQQFQESFSTLIKIIDDFVSNLYKITPVNSKSDIDTSANLSMLFDIKNNLIKINEKIDLSTLNIQNNTSISKEILNIVHLLNDMSSLKNISGDSLFQNHKTQNLLESFLTEFRTELLKMFDSNQLSHLKSLYENTGDLPLNRELSQFIKVFTSNDIKNYFESIKDSPNLKEELFILREKLNYLLENTKVSPNIKKVIEDANNAINQIYKQQFQNLLNTSNNEYNNLNLVYINQNEQLVELPLFFKKHKLLKDKGIYEDSFSVFFSLELSNLKYFEISILDHGNNFDIIFNSEDNDVSTFFRDNIKTLSDLISKHVSKSLSIKTSMIKKHGKFSVNNDKNNLSNKNHLIDLIM